MYSDDDPYLADLRKVCLALPESVEVEAWGRTELIDTSCRQVALARMLKALDQQDA